MNERPALRPRSRISGFRPFDGEVDPSVALRRAAGLGCRIYYPAIASLRSRRMRFVSAGDAGAAETIDPRWLDHVLVPLSAVAAR
jgi:5-formyltetrahydrofolate cyclo-ligase